MKKNFRLLRIILVGIFLLALAWLVRENWKSESREAGAPFFRMAGSFRNFFGLNERSAELEAQKEELRIKLESLEARESEFKDLEKFLVAERPSGKIALILSQAPSSPYDTLLVSAGRDLILVGHIQEPFGFLAAAVFSVVLLFISLIIFHLTETRIAERI